MGRKSNYSQPLTTLHIVQCLQEDHCETCRCPEPRYNCCEEEEHLKQKRRRFEECRMRFAVNSSEESYKWSRGYPAMRSIQGEETRRREAFESQRDRGAIDLIAAEIQWILGNEDRVTEHDDLYRPLLTWKLGQPLRVIYLNPNRTSNPAEPSKTFYLASRNFTRPRHTRARSRLLVVALLRFGPSTIVKR
ncbi:uncharacterized protein LOC143365986 [Andrena cerasifolii]|uniref:uncharacterized protein LOC143365986 n=1 Tax=Andrena cerasifolii TaxID=2819439 RepID=UPI0040380802